MCPLLISKSEPEPLGAIFPDQPTLTRIFQEQVEAGFPADLALNLVLQVLVMRAVDATGASSAALALARGGEMICRAATGLHAPDLGVLPNTGDDLSGACLSTRQPQFCVDTESDPRVDSAMARRLGIRSMLIVPVLDQDGLFGVLKVFSSEPSAFSDREGTLLDALARDCVRVCLAAADLGQHSPAAFTPVPSDQPAIAPRGAPAYVASFRRSPSIPGRAPVCGVHTRPIRSTAIAPRGARAYLASFRRSPSIPGGAPVCGVHTRPIRSTAIAPRGARAYLASFRRSPSIPGGAPASGVHTRPIRSTALPPRGARAYLASLRRSPSIPEQDSTPVPDLELDSWNARHPCHCRLQLHGWLPPRMVGLIIAPGSSPGSPSLEIRCGKAPRKASRAHPKINLAQSDGTFHLLRTTRSHSQRG